MFQRLLVACLLSLGLSASWSVGAVTARDHSVQSGLYTAEQALRGQQQYDVFCTGCHGVEMEGAGVDVPPLADTRFMRKWSGRTLYDLFELIKTSMPENAPGSLSDRAYADLVAYILQANGFPAGSEFLDPARERLSAIVIEPPPR
jgi:quinoprotein glucose dehydrogenase